MNLCTIDEARMPPGLDAEIRSGLCRCFPPDVAVYSHTRAWHGSPPEYSLVVSDADRVLAHLGVVGRTIDVGGRPLRVAGVQNVYVLPEHRGAGLSQQLIEAAMAEADRRAFDCGLLFCMPALATVYAPCGWRLVSPRPITRVEAGQTLPLPGKNIAMFHPPRVAEFPDGPIDLRGNDW
jgi:GNAT superfamily N-acetyltransferase